MLEKLQPDILSFCTLPDTRLELVQLAARTGVKAVCMENQWRPPYPKQKK